MIEFMPPDTNGDYVGYFDGDVHPIADLPDGIDLPDRNDVEVLDPPHYERHDSSSVTVKPDTLAKNRQRIIQARLAQASLEIPPYEDRITPQEELGGGIRQNNHERDIIQPHPLDDVICRSEPWQQEIYDAVERFGLNELSLESYESMSKSEKEAFTLHFRRFYRIAQKRPNLIRDEEGVTSWHKDLETAYGKERSPEDLLAYSELLDDLLSSLEETGIPRIAEEYFQAWKKNHSRQSVYKAEHRLEHRKYQIGFRKDSSGRKKPVWVS